jgi:Carboxypeptidase regulatory-like domain/TonB-dependent Receptor Plug Domain
MKFFSGNRPTASLLVMLAAVLLLAQTALYGQSTGNVTGVVADTTGAVIPKASVVLTDLGTGIKRTVTSNSDGAFAFAGVAPDTSYRLDVSAPNFEPWESVGFAVQAGAQLSYTDIRMKVATAAAAITVEAQGDSDLAALDTGARTEVITAEDLNTLSVIGRDATELVRMLPGFDMSTGNQGLYNRPGYNSAVVSLSGPTGAFSANGAGVTGIAVVTDGVSLTDIASNSGSVQTINIDMVQEVTANNSTYGAEYAKGPAVISADSKRGGSAFHGAAYLVARNTDLNSNDWYDNFLRQSRPAGSYYYPGGNLGGPLLLPFTQFNRGRNKLFFFVGYEYDQQSFEANQQAISSWVPTMAERQGDFSAASLDAELCGARPDGNQNPNAIQAMCNTNNYLPTGAEVTNNNSAPYANGAGAALLNWLPAPNADPFTNPFGYNYIQQVIQHQNVSQFKSTLEYDINDTNKLFLVYGLQREIDQDPVALNQSFPSGAIPYPGDITTGDVSNVLSANYSKFFGSTVTNNLIAAMSYVSLPGKMGDPTAVDRFDIPGNGGNGFNYLGMYKNGGDLSVPAINGNNGVGYPFLEMPGGFYNNQIHEKKVDPIVQDNISWQKGRHFLQFGAYWETGTFNGTADSNAYPQGNYTFNPGNGYFEYAGGSNVQPFAEAQFISCENPNSLGTLRLSGANYLGSCFNPSALMYEGYADSYTQANFTPLVDMRYTTFSGFVNDQLKLHNLTLILGARIEHLGPWADRHNNGLAEFSDSLYTSECGGYTRNCVSQDMPGVTWASQKTGVSNSVNSPPTVYFSPRLGASWDVFGKRNTVLRGGWGVYRNQEQFNPYALAAATAQNYKTSQLVGALTFAQIDSESPLNPPDFTAYTLSPNDTVRPIYYQYNGGIDQNLGGIHFLHFGPSHLSIAYVGSHNVNLGSYNNSSYNSASDINIICGIETGCPANNNPNLPNGVDNLFQVPLGVLPTTLTSIQGVSGGISSLDTPETDFFRPYPFYQHIYRLKHDFYSNYSSVQAEWNKVAGIVTYGANYTFAKNLATGASYNNNLVDPVHLRNDYNPVPYDRTQTFNIHYLINLGTRYRGGAFLWRELANGWQVSGISTVQSGTPLASQQGENFGFGYGSVLPTQVTYPNQTSPSQALTPCHTEFGIQPDSNGNTFCVTSMNPVVWLGTPDVELMPTLTSGVSPRGGPKTHQFINPLAFGLPEPGTNGVYRLPYIHGPYYMDHDVTLLKNLSMGEGKNLQLRMAAFNVFNHPLVSFNNQNTNNLTLAFENATVGAPLTQNVLEYPNFGVADIKVNSRLVEVEGKFTF